MSFRPSSIGFLVLIALVFQSPISAWASAKSSFYEEQVCDSLADYFLGMEDYPEAIRCHRIVIEDEPTNALAHYHLGFAYGVVGQHREELAEYQKAVAVSGGDQDPSASLAHAYAMTGRRPEAEKILVDFQRKSHSGYVSPYLLATIYAGLGEKDRAIELLEKAYRERDMGITWFVKTDPRIDNLRSDPRFEALLQRFNFPH